MHSRVLGDDVELTLNFTRPADGRNPPGPPDHLGPADGDGRDGSGVRVHRLADAV